MSQNDNIFIKIINKELPAHIIYEDDDFLAILDINPVQVGHALLIPKQSCRNIFDMPKDVAQKLMPIAQKAAKAIKKATGADGINLIMNNEPAASQSVFHAHLHIIPRFENDGIKDWPIQTDIPQEVLADTAQKIKKEI